MKKSMLRITATLLLVGMLTGCQCSHEKTQYEDEVLLWDMLLTPSNKSVICYMGVQKFSSLEV